MVGYLPNLYLSPSCTLGNEVYEYDNEYEYEYPYENVSLASVTGTVQSAWLFLLLYDR